MAFWMKKKTYPAKISFNFMLLFHLTVSGSYCNFCFRLLLWQETSVGHWNFSLWIWSWYGSLPFLFSTNFYTSIILTYLSIHPGWDWYWSGWIPSWPISIPHNIRSFCPSSNCCALPPALWLEGVPMIHNGGGDVNASSEMMMMTMTVMMMMTTMMMPMQMMTLFQVLWLETRFQKHMFCGGHDATGDNADDDDDCNGDDDDDF